MFRKGGVALVMWPLNFWALNANSFNSLGGDMHSHERLLVATFWRLRCFSVLTRKFQPLSIDPHLNNTYNRNTYKTHGRGLKRVYCMMPGAYRLSRPVNTLDTVTAVQRNVPLFTRTPQSPQHITTRLLDASLCSWFFHGRLFERRHCRSLCNTGRLASLGAPLRRLYLMQSIGPTCRFWYR